jgi:hypothetical protein
VLVGAGLVAGLLGSQPASAGPVLCVDEPAQLCVRASGAPTVGAPTANTNDYAAVRSADFVTIRFGGVNSPHGGAMGVEPGLSARNLNGGLSYAPCKGTPTALPNVEDPVTGGEPYKAACENTVDPSYYRSGLFGAGLRKRVPLFDRGITIANTDTTQACGLVCSHRWAEKLSRFDVEIYLKKKDPVSGRVVTDFEYVRPRFTVSAFPRRQGTGLVSADWGTITPLKAYARGTARLQGLIFSKGGTRAEAGRVRFSIFENDANGRTSTGQPLQAFSVFTSTGSFYSIGTVYAGSYKMRLTDLETGTCVVLKHLPLPDMGQRIDIHLDRPAFGIPRARRVAC